MTEPLDEISAARFSAAMQKAAEAMRIRVVIDGNEKAPSFTTLAQFAKDNGMTDPEMHALLNRLNTSKLVDGGGGAAVHYRITVVEPSTMLRVGDYVLRNGARAKVLHIETNCRGKYGDDVPEVPWDDVRHGSVVVDLDNGHWAYGSQLQPAPAEGAQS